MVAITHPADISDKDLSFAKDTLQKEYFALSDAIGQLLRSNTDILFGSVTILAATSALAVTYRVYLALIAVPFLVGAFCLVGLRRLAEMLAMGGYRWAIEEILSGFAGGQTVIWETDLRATLIGQRTRYLGFSLFLIYISAFMSSSIAAGFVMLRFDIRLEFCVVVSLAWFAMAMLLVRGVLAVRGLRSDVHNKARKRLEQSWPEFGVRQS